MKKIKIKMKKDIIKKFEDKFITIKSRKGSGPFCVLDEKGLKIETNRDDNIVAENEDNDIDIRALCPYIVVSNIRNKYEFIYYIKYKDGKIKIGY